MIPKKFQSFILPQHKRAVFGAAFVKCEGQSLLYDTKQPTYTGKKRGPKKHGPIALYLRRFLRSDGKTQFKMAQDNAEHIVRFLDNLSEGQHWHEELHGDEYPTFLCMAYAIALDQGV